jgi:hypothetical protein
VTATSDTIAAIQALVQQLQHAAGSAATAGHQAEQGRVMATQLGHSRSVASFAQIHQLLGQVHKTIGIAIAQAE